MSLSPRTGPATVPAFAMSEQRTYPIRCPKCGQSLDAALYESVNVKTDPALKEQLMMNRLNAVTCGQCGLSFRVDKALLYQDPDRQLLIYWLPVPEDQIEDGEARFADWLAEMSRILPEGIHGPSVHLVFNRTELVERIFLKEAGLDERLVEYIKYLIYSKNAGKLAPAEKILLFNAQDSTESMLRFVVQDARTRQFESALDYGRDAYRALAETFGTDDKSADLLELFPGPYVNARALLLKELASESPADPESDPAS